MSNKSPGPHLNWSVWSWKSQTFPLQFRPKKTNCWGDHIRKTSSESCSYSNRCHQTSRAELICWTSQEESFCLAAGVQHWNSTRRVKSHLGVWGYIFSPKYEANTYKHVNVSWTDQLTWRFILFMLHKSLVTQSHSLCNCLSVKVISPAGTSCCADKCCPNIPFYFDKNTKYVRLNFDKMS